MAQDPSLSLFDLPSTIYTKTTKGKGRECLAKCTLEPQTTLFSVYPYATCIFDSFKKRLCARCLAAHPTKSFSLHCLGCDQVYFCSHDCADQYLKGHDQGCCDLLRKLATLKKVDRHMKSVAKLVIMIYWQRRCQNDDSSFGLVHHLESHYDDWSMEMKQEWRRIQDFLWKYLSPLGWLLSHETEVDIMHLASKVESNGFGIYLENRRDILTGRALYPLASLFNHDCIFNCEVEQWTEEDIEEEQVIAPMEDTQDDHEQQPSKLYPSVFSRPRGKYRQMLIRTTTNIQPDQPLTIGYVDTTLPVASRRQKLLQDYYFTCLCQRCVTESQATGASKAKEKKGKRNRR